MAPLRQRPEAEAGKRYTPRRRRSGRFWTGAKSYFLAVVALGAVAYGSQHLFASRVAAEAAFSLSGAPLGANGLSLPSVGQPGGESTWYCTWSLPLEAQGKGADLVLSNDASTSSKIQYYRSYSGKPFRTVVLGPHSSETVPLSSLSKGVTGGVSLLAYGGQTVALLALQTLTGMVQTPCQATPGFFWLVSGLISLADNEAQVAVYNPFITDAVVDVTSMTEAGPTSPGSYQGLLVASGQTIDIPVSNLVSPSASAGMEIRALSGRVVVSGIQAKADAYGAGVAFAPSTTRPQPQWIFPYVGTDTGATATLVLTNPSGSVVSAEISTAPFSLPTSASISSAGLTATKAHARVEIAPASVVSVALGSQFSIPSSGAFTVKVTTSQQVGIGAAVLSVQSVPNVQPVFSEPSGTPINSAHWLVTESHTFSVDSNNYGKLAAIVTGGGSHYVTFTMRSTHPQTSGVQVNLGPLVPNTSSTSVVNLVNSGITSFTVPPDDVTFTVDASTPIAIAPAYSPGLDGAFVAVPIR